MGSNQFMAGNWLVPALIIIMFTGIIACANKPVSSSSSSSKSGTVSASRPTGTANVAPGLEDQILDLVNRYRKSKGLSPLTVNFTIAQEARKHTMAMATHRVDFGHAGFNIRSKVITSKVQGATSVAENVAYGSQSAKEVVNGWLNSPGHRRNIEGNYKFTGIGVARDQQARLYFTQIFAK